MAIDKHQIARTFIEIAGRRVMIGRKTIQCLAGFANKKVESALKTRF
jgi:hypothetical protein